MKLEKNKKALIVGASGDLGYSLLKMISKDELTIGAHCYKNKSKLQRFSSKKNFKTFTGDASTQKSSQKLIKSFVKWAGGIDYLVQLSGSLSKAINWDRLSQKDWDRDLAVNLSGPFFLAQEAMKHMRRRGGKIILTSTASASHGGGSTSMAYGAAKAGIECITKGLARVGAKDNILVNAIAPGFIKTKFHKVQMKRNKSQIAARAKMVLLQREGDADDVASMIAFLLSSGGKYITGEVFPISGGDWL